MGCLKLAVIVLLEPCRVEDKHNVLGFSYNGIPCKGLGWASEAMENTLALGFRQKDAWDNGNYDVDISLLDEDGNELPLTSGCKHVVSPDGVETHRDFLLKNINMPTNGKVLSKRTAKLFPHLKFAEQASDQLDKIKDSAVVQQIYWRLSDLEEWRLTPPHLSRRKSSNIKRHRNQRHAAGCHN
ncbi:hypothetical protein [Phocaeicola sartorii]|uniref:hypothetical protein n=1 Tax=Phocaeicola sartorii TaxID=671267 RepID=UPI003F69259B